MHLAQLNITQLNITQLNIAKAKYSLEVPEIKEFADNLKPINALAESSRGFIWRLKDESGDATAIQAFSDVKKEWFDTIPEDSYVLWWIPIGYIPTVEEAVENLALLRNNGDTANAFTFKSNFNAAEYVECNS